MAGRLQLAAVLLLGILAATATSHSSVHVSGLKSPAGARRLSRSRGAKDPLKFGPARRSLADPSNPESPAAVLPDISGDDVIAVCSTGGITVAADQAGTAKFQGWGTSLGVWADKVGGMESNDRDAVLKALFQSKNGLGLNIVRYRIPGGYNPTKAGPANALPGFWPAPDQEYDWKADANQREVLLGARDLGADTFIASGGSPPWWMTESGDVAGAAKPGVTNLKTGYSPLYVDYLTEVVRQYSQRPEWNLNFTLLEPFNLPLSEWWVAGGDSEGCYFSPNDMSTIIPLAGSSLEQKGLQTTVAGINADVTQSEDALPQLEDGARDVLSQIHVYGHVDTSKSTVSGGYAALRKLVDGYKKDTWVADWSPRVKGDDLDVALYMARYITQALNILQAQAWVYWQAAADSANGSLLGIKLDGSSGSSPELTKKYWALKHFTKFVLPGSVRISLQPGGDCDSTITAFLQRKGRLAIVITNQEDQARSLSFTLSGFRRRSGNRSNGFRVIRTTARASYVRVQNSYFNVVKQPTISLTVPPKSITTVLITNLRVMK